MKKEKLIALLQALPDDAEVILFTEEGDLRNDFAFMTPTDYDLGVDMPMFPCFYLAYSYHQGMFDQAFSMRGY